MVRFCKKYPQKKAPYGICDPENHLFYHAVNHFGPRLNRSIPFSTSREKRETKVFRFSLSVSLFLLSLW